MSEWRNVSGLTSNTGYFSHCPRDGKGHCTTSGVPKSPSGTGYRGKQKRAYSRKETEAKRQELIDTASDHYRGRALERYIDKVSGMSAAKVHKEHRLAFGQNDEPLGD